MCPPRCLVLSHAILRCVVSPPEVPSLPSFGNNGVLLFVGKPPGALMRLPPFLSCTYFPLPFPPKQSSALTSPTPLAIWCFLTFFSPSSASRSVPPFSPYRNKARSLFSRRGAPPVIRMFSFFSSLSSFPSQGCLRLLFQKILIPPYSPNSSLSPSGPFFPRLNVRSPDLLRPALPFFPGRPCGPWISLFPFRRKQDFPLNLDESFQASISRVPWPRPP